MRLRNSFWGLLGQVENDAHNGQLETVRRAMLTAIDVHCDSRARRLDDEISQAMDIATLWHLRPDLMKAIANSQGEAVAQDCLAAIAGLFNGNQTKDSNLNGVADSTPSTDL